MFGFDPISWLTSFWLVKLILGSSAVVIALCLIAVLWFGKPVIDGLMSLFGPVLAALGRGFAAAFDWLRDVLFNDPDGGVKDILDNWRTVVTVLLLVFVALSLFGGNKLPHPDAATCKPVIDALRKDYKFIPRK